MKKMVLIVLWLLPAINFAIFNLDLYWLNVTEQFGFVDMLYQIIVFLLHIIYIFLIPHLLIKKKKQFNLKEFFYCISSIVFANLILIIPDFYYAMEINDIESFDEDTIFRVIFIFTTCLSIIASGFTLYYYKKK